MTELSTSTALALLLAAALLGGCQGKGASGAPDTLEEGSARFGGTEPGTASEDLLARLDEVVDQLEAGDWRPYLELRAEATAGQHLEDLEAALVDDDPLRRVAAAIVLEDPLTAAGASSDLVDAAIPALELALTGGTGPAMKPLRAPALRTLGRLPRGRSQVFLSERLGGLEDQGLREMVWAALGDNVDSEGATTLEGHYAVLTTCGERRHAVVAARSAETALGGASAAGWLVELAAPEILACADEVALSGADPAADLYALAAAHGTSAAPTLVDHVLLGDVSAELKAHALDALKRAGDSSVGAALNGAMKELEAQGLDDEALAVIDALRGL